MSAAGGADTPCGVLILDKPAGITSHDAVNRVRRLYGTRQVGHTGTLDPMATGVLPLLLGRAVKAAEYLVAETKEYHALLQLGIATDTEDTTGKALFSSPRDALPGKDAVLAAAMAVAARKDQIPPMVSAIKVGGRKLLELAREGVTLERAPRPVKIFDLLLSPVREETGVYRMEVVCSAGTYIRSLCRDIGQTLGCGGAMAALRRVRSGGFSIENAISLEDLEKEDAAARAARLFPLESIFAALPRVILPPFFERLAKSGQEIYLRKLGKEVFPEGTPMQMGERARLCGAGGRFFALGEVREFPDGLALRPVKQFLL